jgi:integrase/recombinase XerD
MPEQRLGTRIMTKPDYLFDWAEAWLIDCKVRNLSGRTIDFYREKVGKFIAYCEGQVISTVGEITPDLIRRYLLYLGEGGHNPGGIHAHYRTIRVFLKWYEVEVEPDNWKNPIDKIKPPRATIEPLQPIDVETIRAMTNLCARKDFTGDRDRSILLSLLDTGARAREFLDLDLQDVNLFTGEVLIRQGKDRLPRTVFIGRSTRKHLRAYLQHRRDNNPALWVNQFGERLREAGLRSLVRRRAAAAQVNTPGLHDFRRGFAIQCWRNGMDVLTISRILGHKTLETTKKYLRFEIGDLAASHLSASPVDRAGL